MYNLNWEFFEAYKSLDELCKQVLSSNKGVSEYIDEMSKESQGRWIVACWEKDYKQLKRMRWIRNQLAHEAGSFQDNFVTTEDVEWLKSFRSRILNSSDPFSLLYQSKNSTKDITKNENQTEVFSQTNGPENNGCLFAMIVALLGMMIIVFLFYLIF